MPFLRLFEQGRMRDLDLPNRLVMAPMESNLASADGSVSETQIEYYRVRAAGGVGMVIVEYTCVDRPQGLGGELQLGLDTDDLIASHACLVKTVHAEGSRIAVQLFHAGRQTHPKFTGGLQPIAASSIPCPMYRKMPREMTVDDMVAVAQKFKQAAQRAARAGYDAVEIHGAHGYLLANFLSAASNKRTDAFGGSLGNRQKFPLMIVTAVREGAGDLPVIFRLSADEFVEGGTRIDEACDTARKLVDAGVDVLHVSTGCHERIDRNVDPIWMPEGWRIPFARQIREAAGAPVIAVGVIRRPEMAEHAIENGSADFIALGRALLADPEWPKKARAGKVSDIRPCTSCNWCVAQIGTGHTPVGCAENPRAGRENHPFPVHVAGGPTAVVVGSGPGGIAAALTLDHAGYHVILMERHSFVASGLMASAAAPKKDKFHWYRDYLLRKLDSSGVDVQLNCEATADAIAGIDPTIVIEATGARDRILTDIEGLDQPHVKSAYDVLAGNDGIGEGPIVIYGAGEVGCEAAKFAAEKGFDVVLATRSADKDALSRANPLRIFRERFVETIRAYPNIRVELGVKLQSIRADRVVVVQDGEENTWKAGTILMAVGRLPDSHLALELEERGIRALVIGDASEVRRIGDAVHEAYSAVRDITLQAAPGGEPLKSLAI